SSPPPRPAAWRAARARRFAPFGRRHTSTTTGAARVRLAAARAGRTTAASDAASRAARSSRMSPCAPARGRRPPRRPPSRSAPRLPCPASALGGHPHARAARGLDLAGAKPAVYLGRRVDLGSGAKRLLGDRRALDALETEVAHAVALRVEGGHVPSLATVGERI